jgi:uncharacterized membrane protein
MLGFRYVALLALVVWLGGMVLLGLVVAPTTFRVLQAQDPQTGRVLAGSLFGEMLRIFHYIAYACAFVIFSSLMFMKLVGPPPHQFFQRASLVVVMLALALYSGVPLTREIAQVQSQVSGPMNQLPKDDARRARFDRLHQTSTALMTINMALGLVLLFWYVRE